MAIVVFLLNLSGATVLLLYAVRMVQKGIDRAIGPSLRRFVRDNSATGLHAALAGLLLAMALQSATAAGLLISGMVGTGLVNFGIGLSAVLGADLGSALVILVLSFGLDWLVPVLLTAGGLLRLRAQRRTPRQVGRILIGIAFILLALRLIRHAVQPIADSTFLPAVAGYLDRDVITAFLTGAALAFAMHSSVAAILMVAALASAGALPVSAALAVVVGANMGAAVLLVWLSRGAEPDARQLPLANLLLRGGLALAALAALAFLPVRDLDLPIEPGREVVLWHLSFNAALVMLALPFAAAMQRPVTALASLFGQAERADGFQPASALDDGLRDQPALAIASVTREVQRMLQIVERMIGPAMEFYRTEDRAAEDAVRDMDRQMDGALDRLRAYIAAIARADLSKAQARELRERVEYSINLETAAGLVAQSLLPLARETRKKSLRFSDAGWRELQAIHDRLVANVALASNTLVSGDVEIARMLIQEKTEMAVAERKSRKNHLKRLQTEPMQSLETSDIHLETLRTLREINSFVASVAYPVLDRDGQLLQSRLIDTTHGT